MVVQACAEAQSNLCETEMNCEHRRAAVPRDLPLDGLAPADFARLATEGAYQLTEKKMMGDREMGVVRHILTALGGVLVYMGYTDEGTWTMVAGSLATMVGFIWSWMAKA